MFLQKFTGEAPPIVLTVSERLLFSHFHLSK